MATAETRQQAESAIIDAFVYGLRAGIMDENGNLVSPQPADLTMAIPQYMAETLPDMHAEMQKATIEQAIAEYYNVWSWDPTTFPKPEIRLADGTIEDLTVANTLQLLQREIDAAFLDPLRPENFLLVALAVPGAVIPVTAPILSGSSELTPFQLVAFLRWLDDHRPNARIESPKRVTQQQQQQQEQQQKCDEAYEKLKKVCNDTLIAARALCIVLPTGAAKAACYAAATTAYNRAIKSLGKWHAAGCPKGEG